MNPGTSLGPYRILAPLGAGGMGEVYRAHDPRLGRDVAIKVLAPHLTASPEARARFEREARTISKLNHPHICTLHDVGRHGDTDYLVMELLEGETLAHRLERGPLPLAEVLALGSQIADALDAAHRHGVVHRDLKPGNVMLTRSGAKLMDFGLARVAGQAGFALAQPGLSASETLATSPTPFTAEGTIVGTLQYMAPEQLEGKSAGVLTDLWALGCLLYEMATGTRAFAGASQASLISSIMKDEPKAVTELSPLTPPSLDHAVRRCLAKDPTERWQAARDVSHELGWISEAGSRTAVPASVAPASRLRRQLVLAGGIITAVIVTIAALLMMRVRPTAPPLPAPAPTHGRAEVAVLPFQNLSAEGPNTYFAGGLHEELLTQLAKVVALKVISRTSVLGYAGTNKSLKQIAGELGVGSIVEGSVQVAGNRLRVNVQLIDASTDEHLWAERYDRTLDDAFAIESDVAQRIVQAVGAALAPAEQQALSAPPTANPEAYQLYLRGWEYINREHQKADDEAAMRCYEQALALDPGFSLAHAALATTHGRIYWLDLDTSPTHRILQREHAETAVRLSPRSPEAHVALGLAHYWGRRDYRSALEEFRLALRESPGDADAWAGIGYVERRLGNEASVDSALETCTRLNPRYADGFAELAYWYYRTHRYPAAINALGRYRAVDPDSPSPPILAGLVDLAWRGDTERLKTALAGLPPLMLSAWGDPVISLWGLDLLLRREPDSLLAGVRSVSAGTFDLASGFQPHLFEGWAYQMKGQAQSARAAFTQALAALDTVRVGDAASTWHLEADRGLALAGLGRKDEALRATRRLRETLDYREDALEGPVVATARAMILSQVGEADAACDELDHVLTKPSEISVPILRLDPRFDPIRRSWRFQALLAKYAGPEPKAP